MQILKNLRSYFYTAFNTPRKPAPIKGLWAVALLPPKSPKISPFFTQKNTPIFGPILPLVLACFLGTF